MAKNLDSRVVQGQVYTVIAALVARGHVDMQREKDMADRFQGQGIVVDDYGNYFGSSLVLPPKIR